MSWPGFPANNPEPTRVEEAGPSDGLTELAAAERFVEKIAGGYLFNITTRKWHVCGPAKSGKLMNGTS